MRPSATTRIWQKLFSVICQFTLAFVVLGGSAFAAELQAGQEYNLRLDTGEQLLQAKVVGFEKDLVVTQIPGLVETIRIPRAAIVEAVPFVVKRRFSEFELRGLAGGFLALADLQLLSSKFPLGGVAFTAYLSERMRFTKISALSTELHYAFLTDSERRLDIIGFAAIPRWHWRLGNTDIFLGTGAGVNGLYLKSYNFTRPSSALALLAEVGVVHRLGARIRLYASARFNYWLDSKALLLSTGIMLGVGYAW